MSNQPPSPKPADAEQPSSEKLDETTCSAFLILWHGVDKWEWIEGDLCHAHEEATINRRHLNYGRKGYSIIPCPSRPVALLQTPEDTLLDSIFGQNSQDQEPR